MALRRIDIQERDPADLEFLWATGIEDTFITEPWPSTGRILDEYELTGHYDLWERDLDLMASLGVRTARYGIPWHRINPEPDRWDWRWADGPLNRLVDLGIDPIVDLVHYATPSWLKGAFASPDYPSAVAEFARRVADRFYGSVHCYTPLNEPRITAWYCGRLGWWPPHHHGERGFLRVMIGVCKGIVLSTRAIRAADPQNVIVHVDATDLYEPGTLDLTEIAVHRQEIVYLAMDLILGRVDRGHALWRWCLKNGVEERDLAWFLENPIEVDICGINLYPMFSRKILRREVAGTAKIDDSADSVTSAGGDDYTRTGDESAAKSLPARNGRIRIRMPYASAEIVDRLVRSYYERYHLPIMITETASRGSVERRMQWLRGCVEAVRRCRGEGLPLIGYTWWPMYALIAWAYRQGTRDPSAYLEQMGLWDLVDQSSRPGDGNLARVETELVAEYRRLAKHGSQAAGQLALSGMCVQRELAGAAT